MAGNAARGVVRVAPPEARPAALLGLLRVGPPEGAAAWRKGVRRRRRRRLVLELQAPLHAVAGAFAFGKIHKDK